jgi:hypothetical protein
MRLEDPGFCGILGVGACVFGMCSRACFVLCV